MSRDRAERAVAVAGDHVRILIAAAFVGTVVAANYATSKYGMVPVGFGLVATAGTYFAGLAFVLRDLLQDRAGKRWVAGAIIVGAVLSYLYPGVAARIALASGVAFLVSELVDFAIYTPLRRRGYVRAAVASNLAGAFVDTVLFLWIAGFFAWDAVPGQMVGKMWITAATIALVGVTRALVRQPKYAEGA